MEEQLRNAVLAAGVASVETVERKAAELLRLMQVKMPAGTLRKVRGVCVYACIRCVCMMCCVY